MFKNIWLSHKHSSMDVLTKKFFVDQQITRSDVNILVTAL